MGRDRREEGASRAVVIALGLMLPLIAVAQEPEPDPDPGAGFLNFAYAAQLGVGFYKVDDDLRVATVKFPIKLRVASAADDRWSLAVRAPVTFGHYRAREELVGIEFFEEADAISFIPGAELQIRVADNWRLAPFLDVGYGWDLGDDNDAALVSTGLRSRAHWPWKGLVLTLGNGVAWAANYPERGSSRHYALITNGLDFRLPTRIRLSGRDNQLSVYVMHLHFLPRVELDHLLGPPPTSVDHWEVGLTFGSDEARRLLGLVPLRRVGLAYRFGDSFRGFRVTTRFPF